MKHLKITYNAPFTLSFCLLCVISLILALISGGATNDHFFSIIPGLAIQNPLTWLRFFTHALGHASLSHLAYNMTIILLIGPLLEEKYGVKRLLLISLSTAFITGFVAWALTPHGLLGASGICFAFIVLSSIGKASKGSLPLTFVLIVCIFLGNEIINSFNKDNVSQLAHLLGGVTGSIFGFIYRK